MNAEPSVIRSFEVPKLDSAILEQVSRFWWPIARLGEGIEELARVAGLTRAASASLLTPPPADFADQADWMAWASARLGIEAEAVDAPLPEAAEAAPRRAGLRPLVAGNARSGLFAGGEGAVICA